MHSTNATYTLQLPLYYFLVSSATIHLRAILKLLARYLLDSKVIVLYVARVSICNLEIPICSY